MVKRRLFLQIYFTIIASLVIVAVLSGLLWSLFGRDLHWQGLWKAFEPAELVS